MAADNASWCLIESDPGVFTELLTEIGVNGVQVEEIYDLDPNTFAHLGEVYGLIFLFKWTGKQAADSSKQDYSSNIFFAQQVINNACATLALLNVIMNVEDLNLGAELMNFKEFVADFPPDMKGEAITNSLLLRTVHNSFSRAEGISVEDKNREGTEDAFHFIGFVPVNGSLYELDGLQNAPINHGTCTSEDFLLKLRGVIEEKISKYESSEIRFNLMAIVKDRKIVLNEQLELLQKQLNELANTDENGLLREQIQNEIADINMSLQQELAKRESYRIENSRRRHNFIPFVYNLLKHLADKNKLQPLVQEAKSNGASSMKE